MLDAGEQFARAFVELIRTTDHLTQERPEADRWEIADGLLGGALQYWLYSRQSCGCFECDACVLNGTAEGRMVELHKLMLHFAFASLANRSAVSQGFGSASPTGNPGESDFH